ncbi:MAG: hypothetical protein ACRC45_06425 [Cetobacterium sp.]
MVLLRTPEGELTFTFDGDDRLETVFKDWEQLKEITNEEHVSILEMLNSCEWDLKVVYENDQLIKVKRYTPEEEESIIADMRKAEHLAFYESEKAIGLLIEEDYRLELEDISDEQMKEVKLYLKALKPNPSDVHGIIPKRPEIFEKYTTN